MPLQLATLIRELEAALRRSYRDQRVAEDLERALAAYMKYWLDQYFTEVALKEMIDVLVDKSRLEVQRQHPTDVAAVDALVARVVVRCLRDARPQ